MRRRTSTWYWYFESCHFAQQETSPTDGRQKYFNEPGRLLCGNGFEFGEGHEVGQKLNISKTRILGLIDRTNLAGWSSIGSNPVIGGMPNVTDVKSKPPPSPFAGPYIPLQVPMIGNPEEDEFSYNRWERRLNGGILIRQNDYVSFGAMVMPWSSTGFLYRQHLSWNGLANSGRPYVSATLCIFGKIPGINSGIIEKGRKLRCAVYYTVKSATLGT